MKKKDVAIGIIIGMTIMGAGAAAVQYTASDNPFPVQLNGENVQMEGYNINDSTYFKLRDIADIVGGFGVDFHNNTIQLSKDGYVYDNSEIDYSKYIGDFYTTQEPEGRYWFGYELKINSIDGNTVNFDYQHPKSGRAINYTANTATFINENTAVATGTSSLGGSIPGEQNASSDVEYTLVFDGDTVSININHKTWSSDETHTYNIYSDLRSNYAD